MDRLMNFIFVIAIIAAAVIVITIGFNQNVYSSKIPSAPGAMDACLQSGYSYQYCKQILMDPDPAGTCGWLEAAGLPCPIR